MKPILMDHDRFTSDEVLPDHHSLAFPRRYPEYIVYWGHQEVTPLQIKSNKHYTKWYREKQTEIDR